MRTANWTRRDVLKTGASALAAATARWPRPDLPKGQGRRLHLPVAGWRRGAHGHLRSQGRRAMATASPAPTTTPSRRRFPGARVCEHLKKSAPLLDRCVLVRSLQSRHLRRARARRPTWCTPGRMPSGTIIYPSIGSIVSHELGTEVRRGAGVRRDGLPEHHSRPWLPGRQVRLRLSAADRDRSQRPGPSAGRGRGARGAARSAAGADCATALPSGIPATRYVQAQTAISEQGFKLAGPRFLNVFDLKREPASLREAYGGEFGQRCLLARRLVQSGVRFVEVSFNLNFLNGAGWDTHNAAQVEAAPADSGSGPGVRHAAAGSGAREAAGHHAGRDRDRVRAAAGVRQRRRPRPSVARLQRRAGGRRIADRPRRSAQTDELAKTVVERPVSIPDFHATIHSALGIDPNKVLFAGSRPVPITDHGKPVAELFG